MRVNKLPIIIFASIFTSGLCIFGGIVISFQTDLPTGPAIVCIYAGVFLMLTIGGRLVGLLKH